MVCGNEGAAVALASAEQTVLLALISARGGTDRPSTQVRLAVHSLCTQYYYVLPLSVYCLSVVPLAVLKWYIRTQVLSGTQVYT